MVELQIIYGSMPFIHFHLDPEAHCGFCCCSLFFYLFVFVCVCVGGGGGSVVMVGLAG